VNWSVDSISGGNSTVGTATAAGLYTAPSRGGTHTVTATSVADTTKTASATVTVAALPAVSIQLSQTSVTMLAGAQQQFTVVVQCTSNTAATWAVDTVVGGNSTVGTVTPAGLYTAPSQAGMHTVTATSVADPTKTASALVTVQQIISVTPSMAGVVTAETQQFTAAVQGQATPAVIWSVDGVTGGNATVGTIDSQGLYTAPSQIGSHTVAANLSNLAENASATIAVFRLSVSAGATLVAPGARPQFTATIQGLSNTSVDWSVDGLVGGSSSVGTITSTGLYTAPSATGGHTISADSIAYPSSAVRISLTVVNSSPGAVLTYHNDDARDGAFTQETTLAPTVVNSTHFGKLLSYPVDGQVYAQPLFVPQLPMGGVNHNVVFVATENDTVYAFDADGSQTTPLWSKSLGSPSPRSDAEGVSPFLGITSTPVIDITTGTIYVVAETALGPYLHALAITSGAEKLGGPVLVDGSV